MGLCISKYNYKKLKYNKKYKFLKELYIYNLYLETEYINKDIFYNLYIEKKGKNNKINVQQNKYNKMLLSINEKPKNIFLDYQSKQIIHIYYDTKYITTHNQITINKYNHHTYKIYDDMNYTLIKYNIDYDVYDN